MTYKVEICDMNPKWMVPFKKHIYIAGSQTYYLLKIKIYSNEEERIRGETHPAEGEEDANRSFFLGEADEGQTP